MEVTGGLFDPESRFMVDVETVQRAAVAYQRHGLAMMGVVADLMAVCRMVTEAVPSFHPVARVLDATALVQLASQLTLHSRERQKFARRCQEAVVEYTFVDESNAQAFKDSFDRVLPAWFWGTSEAEEPRCAGARRAAPRPGEEYYLPPCPDLNRDTRRLRTMYRPQALEISDVWTLSEGRKGVSSGVAGILQDIENTYEATSRSGSKIDAIDVQKRTWTDAQGKTRTSYVVLLPGTSVWDLPYGIGQDGTSPELYRSMRANVDGAEGRASAEAILLPEVLRRAGVPPGSDVLLAGHSQGGMTAVSAAALPGMRAYRTSVLTAGSPVGLMPAVPGVKYTHLAARGDIVPTLEERENRRSRNQVTVKTGTLKDLRPAHSMENYITEARHLDADRAKGVTDPSLAAHINDLDAAGHLRRDGCPDRVETTRVSLRRLEGSDARASG